MSELLLSEGLDDSRVSSAETEHDEALGVAVIDDDVCSEEDEHSVELSYEEWLIRREIGIREFQRNYDPSVWDGPAFVWDRTTGLVTRDVRNCGDRYDGDDN